MYYKAQLTNIIVPLTDIEDNECSTEKLKSLYEKWPLNSCENSFLKHDDRSESIKGDIR